MNIELSWSKLNDVMEYDNIDDVVTRLRNIMNDKNNGGEEIIVRLRDKSYAKDIHRD